ncbi:sugar O-acetyltransferase [Pediococcus siamensis]|uniref:sugar O-acetyltransferase n=1 Tax=Pediococcus siamensis TaxID=381829 RepID=UPI0039A2D2AA
MTNKERMLNSQLYVANDPELRRDFKHGRVLTRLFNQTTEEQEAYRRALISKIFGKVGDHAHVEPPFHTDYGINTTIGQNFYANYDCIFIDVGQITIGDNVMFGPRVGLYTAGHPIDPTVRNEGYEYGYPITIGNNVWIGGNVVVNPGVNIGNNVVIGSGSIVTHDIPDNVIAVGNPCRILREINDEDKQKWEAQKQAYLIDEDTK